MEDYDKGTIWFEVYTKWLLPIFLLISIMSFFATYGNAFTNLETIDVNFLGVLGIMLDIIYIGLSAKVAIDLYDKTPDSVTHLLVLLGFNWFYKSLGATLKATTDLNQLPMNWIIAIIICSIYYVPNMLYFYNRIDIFDSNKKTNSQKKRKNVKEKYFLWEKKLSTNTIEELNTNNSTGTDIFCTNCGKKISENWNFCNHCGYKLK